MSDLLTELTSWARELRFEDIPAETVELAVSQVVSNLAAVRASTQHPLGQALVAAFGRPDQPDPQRAAQVLAALAMCLEFDEVAYSGHPSASCVNVALAYAAREGLDGKQFITAVVAANECATRLQAATILASFFRGQSATYPHLLGAVVARLHAQGARAEVWKEAAGLALGILPTPVHRAFLDGDAKAMVAATPVRLALDACDAAAAGLIGGRDLLEGDDGVLALLADVPMPEAVVAHLGKRWHTDTLSFKLFPGSGYLQAPYECAQRLARRHGPFRAGEVEAVRVDGSWLTWQLQRKSDAYQGSAATAARLFSAGYGIATLLLTGSLMPADLAVDDPERWDLAGKVEVHHDEAMSLRMLAATVPLGEALRQAGPRALEVPTIRAFGSAAVPVLESLGPPADSFADATMAIGARVEVTLTDGTTLAEEVEQATGMAGPATRAAHREIVAGKWRAVGGAEDVLAGLGGLVSLDAASLAAALGAALSA